MPSSSVERRGYVQGYVSRRQGYVQGYVSPLACPRTHHVQPSPRQPWSAGPGQPLLLMTTVMLMPPVTFLLAVL